MDLFGILFLCVFVSVAKAADETVCYTDLGCFDKGWPFYDFPDRPISYLPHTREEVGTEFQLNTRRNPVIPQYISANNLTSISKSLFNPKKPTTFICHGYAENSDVDWVKELGTTFLNNEDVNIIRINWEKGASILYGQAAANARIVGAEASFLIDQLKKFYGYSASSIYLIGHNLGAHIMAYAGERQTTPKIGRITGLDPAGPYFDGTTRAVRLDTTDAEFIDVIHTDTDPVYTTGMGIYMPVGHMDFYPNGGRQQPGCDNGLIENIVLEGELYQGGVQYGFCDHYRAIDLYLASINSKDPFTAFDSKNYGYGKVAYQAFLDGDIFEQGSKVEMGYNSDVYAAPETGNRIFYSATYGKLAGYQYHFVVYIDNPGWLKGDSEKGVIFVTLVGSDSQSQRIQLTSESLYITPDEQIKVVAMSAVDPGKLSGLYFEWEYDPDWYKFWDWDLWNNPKIYVHKILMKSGHTGNTYTMCGDTKEIEANKDVRPFFSVTDCK
ncbi:pancreatic triacylglycerol lipase-like [Anneissia japonica]|uniref:pancreatic triacylglycerol lipase-like n=1 Tax=Anneissia japonica TaxID=1529436 RepID=UPI0014259A77|nr:pancreatic triacylglycerol lipase-like [Anneissia japonica]